MKTTNIDVNSIELHSQTQPMSIDWKPIESVVTQIAMRIGLIDSTYDDELIGEFVMYWMGQPHRYHTLYQWNHKFVMNLKRKRTVFLNQNASIVGSQYVPKEAGISTDSNARSLVEKYGK